MTTKIFKRILKKARYRSLRTRLENELFKIVKDDYEYFTENLGISFKDLYSCGSFGCAFKTKNSEITAKFTTDHSEVSYYEYCQENKDKSTIIPHIFLIEELPDGWYLILREAIDELLGEYSFRERSNILDEVYQEAWYIRRNQTIKISDIATRNIGKSKIDGRIILFDAQLFEDHDANS